MRPPARRPFPRASAPVRRAAVALAAAAVLALAGCGGGEDDGATPVATTGPVGEAARFRALVVAVCSTTTRAVPDVPDAQAPAAVRRTYFAAVERAMGSLAPELERLATQDAAQRDVLADLAGRMRLVRRVARRTVDGRVPAGGDNDLPGALAKLNVAATRERLPQCGL